MTYGLINVDSVVNSDGTVTGGLYGFKNRIINGAMMIDQRNAGASITPTSGQFAVDRFECFSSQASKYSVQQSTTVPSGFKNSMVFTSLSAYSVGAGDYFGFRQAIEGLNVSDLGWGAVGAATVTLSFWTRSSLTGTFGGVVKNSDSSRSYPFTYTISSANTWEQKTITVAGDTTGTWLTTNGVGIYVQWGLGVGSTYSGAAGSWSGSNYISATGATSVVGTNGATWYITGIQLEKGSTATSFDYRPYGTELQLCQRYYWKTSSDATTILGVGFCDTSINMICQVANPVPMRAAPTLTTSGTASDYRVRWGGSNVTTCTAVPILSTTVGQFARLDCGTAASLTAGYGAFLIPNGSNGVLGYNAEL